MFNEIVAIVVSPFQGENKTDKNGKNAVWLTPIAGKIPNRAMVVAGTVAERASLIAGTTVLCMIVEGEEDKEYGRRFNHTVLGPVEVGEILNIRKKLGSPIVVDVTGGVKANATNGILNTTAAAEGATPILNTTAAPTVDEAAAKAAAATLQTSSLPKNATTPTN